MGAEGIEPPAGGVPSLLKIELLEPPILPLNYAPIISQEEFDF